jgi:hypothetical protein
LQLKQKQQKNHPILLNSISNKMLIWVYPKKAFQ